jgi:aminopeptidase N
VNDFVAGGMENTTLTVLTDGTLFPPETENIRTSEPLVAHELAHQWFGDLVTCKDWSQIWLNEGFATYYETLWLGRHHGTDALRYELLNRLRSLTADPVDTRPIVRRNFGHPDEMFNHLTYPKAGWVLHMLRAQLGPDLFRRCVRTYLERHRLGSVVTEDLNAVVEELSGRSWDQFFDQWIYHGGYPELHATYSWDEGRKIARLSLAQRQAVNDQVLLFRLPLTIRFRCGAQVIDHTAVLETASQDVEVPLPAAPETVRIDPELSVLAKVRFELPLPMILAQLADTNDVVGRLLAVEVLSARKDQSAVDHLRTTLNADPFHGVRSEAARALRSIHSDAALDALIASRAQADARVRLAVVEAIGGFYRDRALEALQETVGREPNPAIRGAALEQLAGYARPAITNLLVRALDSETYRNRLAEAALRGSRLLDHPDLAPAVLSCLQTNAERFTADGFGLGLETLAFLARNDTDRSGPREFLLGHLEHRRRAIREAAARALGTLGDPQALGPLQKLAGTAGHPPDARAAEQAAGTLRAGRRPVDDFKNLRDEVLELQRSSRELRQQLDELKNRQTTSSAPPAASAEPAPAAPRKKARSK